MTGFIIKLLWTFTISAIGIGATIGLSHGSDGCQDQAYKGQWHYTATKT